MRKKESHGFFAFGIIFILALSSIGNWVERYQSTPLLFSYISAFTCFLLILQEKESYKTLFIFGIVARLTLFFSMPSLSDDIYRFLWDGTLLKNGIHPFAELPRYFLNQHISGLGNALYSKLNSPNYFTIYPPINQLIFWLSVQFDSSWLISTNVIRSIILIADIGSFFILKKLLKVYRKEEHLAFFYFLNPLVILECVGNVHFEGIVIFFLLSGILLYNLNKNVLSATTIGLAIGTKLLPLIYLPALFLKSLGGEKWWVAFLAGIVGMFTLLPMLSDDFITGMQSSLSLYFRKFEFNASIYFIARELGFSYSGNNNIAKIGSWLAIISFLSILSISVIGNNKKWILPEIFLFILTSYLLLSTTIHPWYILPMIAFGILSGYWYPIVWSITIFFTYAGYTSEGFELPMWIVVIEYLLVILFFIIDYFSKKRIYL